MPVNSALVILVKLQNDSTIPQIIGIKNAIEKQRIPGRANRAKYFFMAFSILLPENFCIKKGRRLETAFLYLTIKLVFV